MSALTAGESYCSALEVPIILYCKAPGSPRGRGEQLPVLMSVLLGRFPRNPRVFLVTGSL